MDLVSVAALLEVGVGPTMRDFLFNISAIEQQHFNLFQLSLCCSLAQLKCLAGSSRHVIRISPSTSEDHPLPLVSPSSRLHQAIFKHAYFIINGQFIPLIKAQHFWIQEHFLQIAT